MKLDKKGLLVVISGPSGVGKSSVRKALFNMRNHNLAYSISMTTREKRPQEVEGQDYYFVSHEEFQQRIKEKKFLEYAQFCGNFYGTPKDKIDEMLNAGKEVILEIEVEGAQQVMKQVKDAVFIFIVPPTPTAIEERLRNRGTDCQCDIDLRLNKAKSEYMVAHKYDYIVVNDEIYNAADRILAIIRAEHAKSKRTIDEYLNLLK